MTKRFAPAGAVATSLMCVMMSAAAAWADPAAADPVAVPAATPAAPTAAAPSAAAPTAVPAPVSDARKACTDAMNADPQLAAAIVKVADEQAAARRDEATLSAHNDAFAHIQKNERHVIYAYAAMWIVAALFVLFLWRRQQGLTAEIASLRREIELAAEVPPKVNA
ncbi:MAG TPA: hypothetical protein VGC42_18670 [Kofleriaceae bacterium]